MDAQAVMAIAVGTVALGMAFAFVSADRESPMSRAFSGALASLGAAVVLNGLGRSPGGAVELLAFAALAEAGSILLFWEWILRVLHSARILLRAQYWIARSGQLAGLVYALLAVTLPRLRAHDFLASLADPSPWTNDGFWLFAVPIGFATGAGAVSLGLVLRQPLDGPERVRIGAFAAGIPLIVSGYALPPAQAHLAVALGLTVMLVGAVRYHVAQARHGSFMERFLSPQVAALVRAQGLRAAMRERRVELTAVYCDLRGFTRYAQAQPPEYLVQFLREYYKCVGQTALEFGAAVKDFAGDGALILVGAPTAVPDHAERGVLLARRLGIAVEALTRRWSRRGHALGVGIGVASGPVMVGVIASASRYEYAAIGPAINLSARLCQHARPGELLVHCDTLRQTTIEPGVDTRASEQIKLQGFAQPVCYAVLEFGTLLAAA